MRDELESTQGWRRCWLEGMNDVANSFLPAVHGVRVGADVLLAALCKRSLRFPLGREDRGWLAVRAEKAENFLAKVLEKHRW